MSYLKTNKNSWNQRVQTHVKSAFYDVAGFLAGNSSLNEIELAGLVDVEDKSLLHLQCHFGLDTLSWARKGAQVTGVDISDTAIAQAQALQEKTGLPAKFITADVYQFGQTNQQMFDVVFTSYGAICWLPDLTQWAKVVASSLKPGGVFYMVEFHPLVDLLSGYRYFHHADPDLTLEGTYTENCDGTKHEFAVWTHTVSDVISALIKAGLSIKEVQEFDYSPYNCFAGMEEKQPGKFYLEHKGNHVPMVYSIKATKV